MPHILWPAPPSGPFCPPGTCVCGRVHVCVHAQHPSSSHGVGVHPQMVVAHTYSNAPPLRIQPMDTSATPSTRDISVRASERASVRACVRACVCMRVCTRACLRIRVRVLLHGLVCMHGCGHASTHECMDVCSAGHHHGGMVSFASFVTALRYGNEASIAPKSSTDASSPAEPSMHAGTWPDARADKRAARRRRAGT